MKTLIAIFMMSFSFQASAIQIDLNVGDSVKLTPYSETYVTCGGSSSGANCSSAVAAFKARLEMCYNNQSGSYCAGQYWPQFVQENPHCKNEGVSLCVEYCYKNQSGSYCANLCR